MENHEYVLTRIESVLKRETVCLRVELHRRLGEVGQPRLDPRLVDLVLEEHLRGSDPRIDCQQQDDLALYALSGALQHEVQSVTKQKVALYRRAMRFKDSAANVESLHRMLLLAAEQGASEEPGACIVLAGPQGGEPASFAFAGSCASNGTPFKVFVSNEIPWIYPHTAPVWAALRESCGGDLATPILVGRMFHPSCFSLFKTVGIFGHQTYKLYYSPHVWPDFDRLRAVLGFPTGSTDAPDDGHVAFFARTLPRHIGAAFDSIDSLAALISEFSVERGLADPDLDPGLRLSRFASFLSHLPTTHLVRRLREDADGAWRSS